MSQLNISIKACLVVLIIVMLGGVGCSNVKYNSAQEAKYFKPTIAVMSFENRTPVHTRWQLGSAMAEQLTDRLMATRRYIVLERAQMKAIMQELHRTENPEFRKTGQPQRGRLKHVQYLIKGTITDFGHIEKVEGILGPILSIFGTTGRAVVAATIYVIDVQTGQVVASSSVEARIKAKKEKKKIKYDGMAFGGYTFYHTPLGRATNKMLDKAVREIARAVAEKSYQPKIASITNGRIVVNGGRNRRIKVGDEFEVRPASERITDPDSGDVIGHITGSKLGRVRIVQVTGKYSIAELILDSGTGQFAPGQTLFPVTVETTGRATAVSSY